MSWRRNILALAVLLSGLGSATIEAKAADGPTLLKRTIKIKLHRFGRYWPNPTAKEPQYNTFCWVPNLHFEILGPVPGGSQFVAEFSKPDGSAWISTPIRTEELADDVIGNLKTDLNDDKWEKKAVTGIGTFPFKLRLKNELTGKNEVLFSGKYEVTKFPLPYATPTDKNKMDFNTVEDWRVPISFLWLNPQIDEKAPALSAQMWFRGQNGQPQGLLFYNGKQIADANGNNNDELPTPGSEAKFNWYQWTFLFAPIRGMNPENNKFDGMFVLDQNPGEYEIRVLQGGKLARTAKFTVGADGKIVDNGIATGNKLGGIRMVLPTSVVGTLDGPLKTDYWKTAAFYGNPLTGFTAPTGGATPIKTAAATPTTATPTTATDTIPDTSAAAGPKILKSTLVIRADRMVRYWKQPDTDNYWSWVPSGRFFVLGPVPAGTKFVVDFTKPDGSLWTSVDCACEAAGENEMRGVAIAGAAGHMDKRAITDAGTFGFKIRYANEATGAKGQLMTGKFTVEKFHKGNALPAFKNQFEYYVDQDWLLPIGYLWTDWLREPKAPPLHVNMWIKNSSSDNTKIAAYLFYNGKQLGGTKDTGSAGTISSILTNAADENDPTYYLWDFTFSTVRAWNTDDSGNRYDAHFLDKNPGEYEVKVLFNGSLVRVAKFTVGADGKTVDNGIATNNKIGGISMVLPVKVQGAADGKWDATAWKTEAFYGNPLTGFTAP